MTKPYYIPEGDMIEFVKDNRDYYADWICPGVTFYRDHETDEVIGFALEGIKHILKRSEEEKRLDPEYIEILKKAGFTVEEEASDG